MRQWFSLSLFFSFSTICDSRPAQNPFTNFSSSHTNMCRENTESTRILPKVYSTKYPNTHNNGARGAKREKRQSREEREKEEVEVGHRLPRCDATSTHMRANTPTFKLTYPTQDSTSERVAPLTSSFRKWFSPFPCARTNPSRICQVLRGEFRRERSRG